ncbi:acyl-CoA N-acyltransferase, partial [Corynespora cassiicola Philippines]
SPLPPPTFTSPRLTYRPMHPQDAPWMVQHAGPPSITKFMSLSFAHPYTLAHAETWIGMNLAPPITHFVICERDRPDVPIGGIGIKPGADVQTHAAEVGYWVGEPFQGRGYVTEGVEALAEWAFGVREGTKRLWAGVFSGNDASMRVLKKCGYEEEGVMRGHVEKHGVTRDLHLFGLNKADWEKRR